MSYSDTTDLSMLMTRHVRDFKDKLIEYEKILKQVMIGQTLCIVFKKDKRYYKLVDVALWSKCGNIKTALFLRLRNRPKGRIKEFHGREQFLVKHKDKYAIYGVHIYARSKIDPNIMTDVGFQKIPNLQECMCN